MEESICAICGSTNFNELDGLNFCSVCQSQSQVIRSEPQQEAFISNLKARRCATIQKQKFSTEESSSVTIQWTTNEAFNIILKKLVDILIKMGADKSFENTVLQLWVTFLRKTKFAFCKPEYQTKEWKPKVPVLARDRDKQVLLENKHLIVAKKFRKRLLKTIQSNDYRKLRKKEGTSLFEKSKAVKKSIKKKKHNKTKDKPIEMEKQSLDDLTKETKEEENEDKNDNLEEVLDKSEPKRKRQECTSWNSVSLKSVGVIGRMSLERLLEILYLGLLLTHERVLLCDLLRWIENSELPFRECAHLLPENMKFQTYDNNTFRMRILPTPDTIRRNTAKLAKFLDIHSLPSKRLSEIVGRFVVALNLPDQINQLIDHLIELDPPKMPFDNSGKKKVYPIPNYEGRALGFIVVVLKLLFGLDGKTEIKQSSYSKNLAALIPDQKFFIWEDWVAATNVRSELIRRKNMFGNMDCIENFTDVDQVVNYYLKTAQFHKGRFSNFRYNFRPSWLDNVRNPVKESILELIPGSDVLMRTEEGGLTMASGLIGCDGISLIDNVVTSSTNSGSDNFHEATLNHIIDPTWIHNLLRPKSVSLKVKKTTAWKKSKTKSSGKPLIMYQPFHKYVFSHYWKDKRKEFNFVALNELPRSLVWLIDVCSDCGRVSPESLYDEVMLIERVIIKSSSENNSETKIKGASVFNNINKTRTW